VSARSPATTAATKVDRAGTDSASSTMFGFAADSCEGGNKTPSMMCATPFEARLSAAVTLLSEVRLGPTLTTPPHTVTCKFLPSTVFTAWKSAKSVDRTCSGRTWYVKISTNCALFAGFIKESIVFFPSAPKASFVGAKTVKGPAELRVSARSPATTAATKVDRAGTDSASSTMFGFAADSCEGGNKTPSMMCATPFEARLSAAVTLLSEVRLGPTFTTPPHTETCKFLPSTVFTAWKGAKSVDRTCSGRTWYVKISTNCALLAGFIKESTTPAGSAANASFVGAKTVKGPAELRVSARSPATTAATKVDRAGTDSASSTMFGLVGFVGGNRTPSMMWTTPLLAKLSAAVTFLKSLPSGLTLTPFLSLKTCKALPSSVFTLWLDLSCVDLTSTGRTW